MVGYSKMEANQYTCNPILNAALETAQPGKKKKLAIRKADPRPNGRPRPFGSA